jgi:hypothetical protein
MTRGRDCSEEAPSQRRAEEARRDDDRADDDRWRPGFRESDSDSEWGSWSEFSDMPTSAVVSAVPGSDTDLTSARQPQQWRRCAWILLPSLHITCSSKKTLPSSIFFCTKTQDKT